MSRSAWYLKSKSKCSFPRKHEKTRTSLSKCLKSFRGRRRVCFFLPGDHNQVGTTCCLRTTDIKCKRDFTKYTKTASYAYEELAFLFLLNSWSEISVSLQEPLSIQWKECCYPLPFATAMCIQTGFHRTTPSLLHLRWLRTLQREPGTCGRSVTPPDESKLACVSRVTGAL